MLKVSIAKNGAAADQAADDRYSGVKGSRM